MSHHFSFLFFGATASSKESVSPALDLLIPSGCQFGAKMVSNKPFVQFHSDRQYTYIQTCESLVNRFITMMSELISAVGVTWTLPGSLTPTDRMGRMMGG
jgi:hypothetical protein